MAQTKKKRRRKRRGTQGGRIDARPRGRPSNRAEARQRARSRGSKARSRAQQARGPKPPTWGAAAFKGILAGALFFGLTAFVFKQPVASAAGLSAFLLVFYIPMGYYVDRFMYQRHLRKQEQERTTRSQRGAGGE
jgi:hypothetical protein